jgi:hypothetical protein
MQKYSMQMLQYIPYIAIQWQELSSNFCFFLYKTSNINVLAMSLIQHHVMMAYVGRGIAPRIRYFHTDFYNVWYWKATLRF